MTASLLRRFLAGTVAATIAVQPLAAQERFYFRNVQGGGGTQAPEAPNTNNPEPGPGSVSVSVGGTFSFLTNEPVSIQPVATNLPGATWSISPALRAGLTFDPSTGHVGGSTEASGPSSHTVTATNGQGSASATFALSVNAPAANPPVISSYPSSFAFVAGEPLSIPAPVVSGGVAPYSYSLSLSSPPFSFSDTTGAISWASPVAGSWNGLVVGVTGANQAGTSSNPFSITVHPALALGGTYPSGMELVVGQSVSIPSPGASGGKPPIAFVEAASGLPNGLSVAANGDIGGSPAVPGPIQLDITVRDVDGRSIPLTFNATAFGALEAPSSALPATLPLNQTIANVSFAPNGGKAPYSYQIFGDLPTGLDFADGILSGTPTVAGQYDFFVSVEDSMSPAQGTMFPVSTEVVASSMTVSLNAAPQANARVGEAIASVSASASGGTAPFTYTLVGNPPPGLAMSGANLVGIPTNNGNYTFSIRATDANQQQGTSTTYAMAVAAAHPLAVSTVTIPGYIASGEQFTNVQVAVTGGVGPFTFTETSGWPPGLDVTSSGVIQGTPSTPGTYTFNVEAKDSTPNGQQTAYSNSLTLRVDAPLVLSTNSLPNTPAQADYSYQVAASGGYSSLTYTVTGLPTGLSASPGGLITGQVASAGNYPGISIQVQDGAGRTRNVSNLTLVVTTPTVSVPRPSSAGAYGGSTWNPVGTTTPTERVNALYDASTATRIDTQGSNSGSILIAEMDWGSAQQINCAVVGVNMPGSGNVRIEAVSATGVVRGTQSVAFTGSETKNVQIPVGDLDIRYLQIWSVGRLNFQVNTLKGGNWTGGSCATAS